MPPDPATWVFPGFAKAKTGDVHGIPAPLPHGAIKSAVEEGRASMYNGKVRDSFVMDRSLLLVTSDRVSAFDRVLDLIPSKGEVLNRISLFWFDLTSDIITNHVIQSVGGRSTQVHKAEPLPIEVVVRGYLTGSAWRDYQAGVGISGIHLAGGMREYQRLEKPVITPSTKAEIGDHDQAISREDIVSRGLVEEALWKEVEECATELFARGSEIAAEQGLILVDSKYEFGLHNGSLMLIDELHTPDSSRYWFKDSYEGDFRAGKSPAKLDKEYLRRWLMDRGFKGRGDPPLIPDNVKLELSSRYLEAYQRITGTDFSPMVDAVEAEYELIESFFRK